MLNSGPAPLGFALIPALAIFGLLYPAGLVALAAAMQIMEYVRRWEKQTT